MNKKILFVIICISISCSFFAQDKGLIKHTVLQGETIYQIAQKYKIEPNSIYNLNPDARNGIKIDMVLIIPTKIIKETSKETSNIHEVAPKETLYGIAKQHGLTIDELVKLNPILETEGLKIGQIINIVANTKKATIPSSIPTKTTNSYTNYEIQSKETLYGLSKKFNLSVEDLLALNPELSSGVQEAMVIKVPNNGYIPVKQIPVKVATPTAPKSVNTNPTTVDIPVEGTKTVSSNAIIPSSQIDKNYVNLSKSLNNFERKKIVLLLPFNVSRIQNDTVVSQQERLKKDAFLNMTLDFYSGALMAIDSAKTIGLNIDVKIFDSQETKNSSNIENLVSQNSLQTADAIIGPFYQSQADKLAALLENNAVPVISPLSKDLGKPSKNSFATMPSNDLLKAAMFDYMRTKNGNIIAVIDAKKASILKYITDNQPDTKFATFNDKGVLSTESLKLLLVKDKINFVVFASERTGMIFSVTNTLINVLSNYQIRLVILEPNPTFDFEEVSLNRLTKLKLTYPSLTKENESDNAKIFEKEFKKKNKIFPNQYATRGFDLTFDTMLRLSQDKSFQETINDVATEQVENKFYYTPKGTGFINKGIYILQYNNDLTISIAE
jgi:LysM repeat protein